MLRSALLVAPLAQLAFGAVANFCVEDPFKQMQHFRDFEPAISRCAVHYPAQTVTKTVSNQCLTMTETVILGTSTIHATNHLACATPHLEVRAELLEDVKEGHHHGDHDHGDHHHGDHGRGHHGGRRNGHHHPKRPHTFTPKHSVHKTSHKTSHFSTHKTVHTQHWTYTGGPGGHTKHTTRTVPSSLEPRNTALEKRGAGPTPAAVMKRDAMATKSAEWFDYYANLAACGYDCIQTACSCVGSAKTVLETPVPTCTSTKTKVTVVHETKTIDVEPTQC